MAVVSSSWNTALSAAWLTSSGWVSTDPAKLLHDQLSAWITAINDPLKIEIVKTPNDATSKTAAFSGSNNTVRWLLRARSDTGSDYGFTFHDRTGATQFSNTPTSMGMAYAARTDSTSKNNYGSYTEINAQSTVNASHENFNLGSGTAYTNYESAGATPWFVYGWRAGGSTARELRALIHLDTSNITAGSYYPTAGLSKFIYITSQQYSTGTINGITGTREPSMWFATSISSTSAPPKGVGTVRPLPITMPFTDGYFFNAPHLFGDGHYLGKIPNDIIFSNGATGNLGDEATVNGVNYRCFGQLWAKI